MTREEAIWWVNHLFEIRKEEYWNKGSVEDAKEVETAQNMAIEALSEDIVRCKDCRHAGECHKSVQYTRNEPNTVTIGYSPIKWCSRGERREESEVEE